MKRPTFSVLAVVLSTAACGPQYDQQELDRLNDELSTTPLSDALANRQHFAPLCDARGYPLVGNINGKTVTSASQFCAALSTVK